MSGLNADNQGTSTRPYLLRALHDWCTDNGFTPYLAVHVGAGVRVPMEYVKNNEIVLNVSFEATSGLQLGNEFIEFKARFGGITRDIQVPVDHVVAIYARENGQGMAFPMPTATGGEEPGTTQQPATADPALPATAVPVPPRGLRLASTEAPAEAVPTPAPLSAADPDGEPPEPAPPAGRPALKRIK
jgi:stringent starvation protein B